MSPPLEQRICPDCGAVFYLVPGVEVELPAHGCSSPEQTPDASQAGAPTPPPEPIQPDPPAPGLFEALQDQTRQPSKPDAPAPGARRGELKEDTAKALREQGYVITEDAHGPRISGSPYGGPPGRALSPSDIVRIAAELDGGVQQSTTLQTCAKCQARTPAGQAACQWCGEPFPKPD